MQGIDIKPRDIDIVTSDKAMKLLKDKFQKYCISDIEKRPSCKKDFECYELKLKIKDVEIHICGENDSDLYMNRVKQGKIIYINIDSYKIPCFDLKSEANAYSELCREKRAELIKDFLNSKRK